MKTRKELKDYIQELEEENEKLTDALENIQNLISDVFGEDEDDDDEDGDEEGYVEYKKKHSTNACILKCLVCKFLNSTFFISFKRANQRAMFPAVARLS